MASHKAYQHIEPMQNESPQLQNQKQPYNVLSQQPQSQMAGQQALKSMRQFSTQTRYKSFMQLLMIILNVGLSSFYFGYILAYLSAVDFTTLVQNYGIDIKKQVAQGLLVGCIPIGGGIGALSASILINKYSRKQSLLIVNIIAFFSGLLLFYPSMSALLLARTLQGMCAGLYSSLVPIIIKQFSPTQISGTLTSYHQILISFGVFFAFAFSQLIEILFQDPKSQKTWKIVFAFPMVILLAQTLFLHFFYNFNTPKYLYNHHRDQQGKKVIEKIYKREYVETVVNEIKSNIGRGQIQLQENNTNTQNQSSQRNQQLSTTPRAAGFVAIYLAALQQFCGVNAILAYGGQSVGELAPSMKLALPILINFQQFVAAAFSSYLLSKIGRKTLFQYGCVGGFVSCFLTAIGFYYKDQSQQFALAFIVIGLIIFMANFGLTLGPVVWVYLPQIIQPSFLPYATGTNWGTAAIIMLFFPVIKQSLPGQNPSLLFLFFAFCCIGAFFINKKLLIQTKGKTQKQISEQFRQKTTLC